MKWIRRDEIEPPEYDDDTGEMVSSGWVEVHYYPEGYQPDAEIEVWYQDIYVNGSFVLGVPDDINDFMTMLQRAKAQYEALSADKHTPLPIDSEPDCVVAEFEKRNPPMPNTAFTKALIDAVHEKYEELGLPKPKTLQWTSEWHIINAKDLNFDE